MHAVPRRHREGAEIDGAGRMGRTAPRRAVGGNGRRVDLRTWPGSAESDPVRDEVFPARDRDRKLAMNMMSEPVAVRTTVEFTLDGKVVSGYTDETIIQTADRLGIEIPRLCYKPGMRPDGNCRACMVEIKGERVLAPSCCRRAQPGMEVSSATDRARRSQKMGLELLLSAMPES